MFSNSDPPAQKKTQISRQQATSDFNKFVCNNFSATSVNTIMTCFGSDQDEQDVATSLFSGSSVNKNDSEALGDLGGIYQLQNALNQNKRAYNDNNLFLFSGANTFNQVYIEGGTSNPQAAIVFENKGGTSQLGYRTDPNTGATVQQGTQAYFDVEVGVMASSNDQKKQDVANALQQLASNGNNKIAYVVVRTTYNKKKQTVYDPVVEHMITL